MSDPVIGCNPSSSFPKDISLTNLVVSQILVSGCRFYSPQILGNQLLISQEAIFNTATFEGDVTFKQIIMAEFPGIFCDDVLFKGDVLIQGDLVVQGSSPVSGATGNTGQTGPQGAQGNTGAGPTTIPYQFASMYYNDLAGATNAISLPATTVGPTVAGIPSFSKILTWPGTGSTTWEVVWKATIFHSQSTTGSNLSYFRVGKGTPLALNPTCEYVSPNATVALSNPFPISGVSTWVMRSTEVGGTTDRYGLMAANSSGTGTYSWGRTAAIFTNLSAPLYMEAWIIGTV